MDALHAFEAAESLFEDWLRPERERQELGQRTCGPVIGRRAQQPRATNCPIANKPRLNQTVRFPKYRCERGAEAAGQVSGGVLAVGVKVEPGQQVRLVAGSEEGQ